MRSLLFTASLLATTLSSAHAAYTLKDSWSGSNFLSNFDFFTASDPTHGFVQYVDASTASSLGLTKVQNGAVIIKADNTTVSSSAGRKSVRITSKKAYTKGLFIFDVNHVPFGCGTWVS